MTLQEYKIQKALGSFGSISLDDFSGMVKLCEHEGVIEDLWNDCFQQGLLEKMLTTTHSYRVILAFLENKNTPTEIISICKSLEVRRAMDGAWIDNIHLTFDTRMYDLIKNSPEAFSQLSTGDAELDITINIVKNTSTWTQKNG